MTPLTQTSKTTTGQSQVLTCNETKQNTRRNLISNLRKAFQVENFQFQHQYTQLTSAPEDRPRSESPRRPLSLHICCRYCFHTARMENQFRMSISSWVCLFPARRLPLAWYLCHPSSSNGGVMFQAVSNSWHERLIPMSGNFPFCCLCIG